MDVRVERLYFVLVWWFSGYGILSPYIIGLVVGCCVCLLWGRAIKWVFFSLKNMGVVDFVVWIFFCNFVDCVWWVVCRG